MESVSGALVSWLDWIGMIPAGAKSQLARYIGYYEPYATNHDTLDKDKAIVEEVRNVARAVCEAVAALREGRLSVPDHGLKEPRRK